MGDFASSKIDEPWCLRLNKGLLQDFSSVPAELVLAVSCIVKVCLAEALEAH